MKLPKYSHIYVEEDVLDHQATAEILSRFKRSSVIPISRYKEIFNRSNQSWRSQKESPKLILALRRGEFLYRGSSQVSAHGGERFFYNSLALNCLYDCSYCYLQGMFPSAYLLLFVNNSDYQRAVVEELANGPMYLCISYETDLLPLDFIYPYCREWVEFSRNHEQLTIEIRTKSAAFSSLIDIPPSPQVILAWTVSPREVIASHEKATPRLAARLKCIREALSAGWRVRLCIDPILAVSDAQKVYEELLTEVEEALSLEALEDISLGVFRMNKDFLGRAQVRSPRNFILFGNFQQEEGFLTYPDAVKNELVQSLVTRLEERTSRPIVVT